MRIVSCLKLSAGAACAGLVLLFAAPDAMALPLFPAKTSTLATDDLSILATVSERRRSHHRNDDYDDEDDDDDDYDDARDVEVDAPTTYVRRHGRNVDVEAPFTSVERSRSGVHVRAPFVDLWVPRR